MRQRVMGCGSLRGGLEPNFKRLSGLLPSDNGQLANDLQRAKGEGQRARECRVET
jgi:hypothetical protein